MERQTLRRIVAVKERIERSFTASDWQSVGLLTNHEVLIATHPRLLRSLSFGDDDYGDCILKVLKVIATENESYLDDIDKYLDQHYPMENTEFVSAEPAERKITFAPTEFAVPDASVDNMLVSAMMPFASDFD